jgi:dihydroceramidase
MVIVSPWDGWRAATCMPDACFCEAIRDGIVRQPANTWSCLAFLVVGAMVIRRTFDGSSPRGGSPVETRATYGVLYGAALILIGLGSGFYHASLSFAGQFADVFGMYLLATFILLYNLARLGRVPERGIAALYVALNAVLAILLHTLPEIRRYAFALLLIAALALEFRARSGSRSDGRFLWIALGSIAAGFAIWIGDITRTACAPTSLVQGHAVWHVAGAVSAWYLYRYYRSESAISRK